MKRLLEQNNDKGQQIVVDADEQLNRRGRVVQTALRIACDATVVYEGPDTPDAQALLQGLLTATPQPEPKSRKRKVTHVD